MNENGCIPSYKYKEASYSSTWYLKEDNTIYQSFPLDYNYSKLKYHCYLKLLDSLPVFCGFGVSIREARMAACKLAYEYLERNDTVMMQLTNLKHWLEEVIFPFLLISSRKHMMTMVIPFGIVNVTQRKKIITLMGHPHQKKRQRKILLLECFYMYSEWRMNKNG